MNTRAFQDMVLQAFRKTQFTSETKYLFLKLSGKQKVDFNLHCFVKCQRKQSSNDLRKLFCEDSTPGSLFGIYRGKVILKKHREVGLKMGIYQWTSYLSHLENLDLESHENEFRLMKQQKQK